MLSSQFDGLLGPIIPGVAGVDPLSLVISSSVIALTVLLILCAPATPSFFRHTILLFLFLCTAIGVFVAQDVIVFYVFWELTSLLAWAIARMDGDPTDSEGATVPFQAAGAIASFLMVTGLLLLVSDRHDLLLEPDHRGTFAIAPLLILAALILKSYGLLSESWNLRPHHDLNIAGAVLGGAGMVTIGLYPFLRFFGPVFGAEPTWRSEVFWPAVGLALVGALAAIGEQDYRRALSYGALGQFGLTVLVVTSGIRQAIDGAVLGTITYAFAYTGLFLCLGVAEAASHQVRLSRVGGLAHKLPATAVLFALCTGAVVGLPPFGSFVVDSLVGGAVIAGPFGRIAWIWIAMTLLTAVYLIRLFSRLFLGEIRGPIYHAHHWSVAIGVIGALAVLVLIGLHSGEVLHLLQPATDLLALGS